MSAEVNYAVIPEVVAEQVASATSARRSLEFSDRCQEAHKSLVDEGDAEYAAALDLAYADATVENIGAAMALVHKRASVAE